MSRRHRAGEEFAMIAVQTTETPTTTTPREVIECFVRLMAAGDIEAIVALYAPNACWDAHVPGWDTTAGQPAEFRRLHEDFFVAGRDDFSVDGYQIVAEGDSVALRWDLSWRDRDDGAHCVSFQSHFFTLHAGRIGRHEMYCAGVRAYLAEA
jgi:ketosteroid isomerase-like protein